MTNLRSTSSGSAGSEMVVASHKGERDQALRFGLRSEFVFEAVEHHYRRGRTRVIQVSSSEARSRTTISSTTMSSGAVDGVAVMPVRNCTWTLMTRHDFERHRNAICGADAPTTPRVFDQS